MGVVDPRGLPQTTLRVFGGEFLLYEPGRVRLRYVVDAQYCNPRGTLQGGMAAVYLDDAMGYALLALEGGQGRFTTLTLTMQYRRPILPGPVIAEACVNRFGRQVGFVSGILTIEDGTVCVEALSTVLRLEPLTLTATSQEPAPTSER